MCKNTVGRAVNSKAENRGKVDLLFGPLVAAGERRRQFPGEGEADGFEGTDGAAAGGFDPRTILISLR